MNNSIIVNKLTFKRGNYLLLKDISFTLNSGEVLFIKGPNGIGKSTLLNCLSGLLLTNHMRGSIYWNDHLIDTNYEWKWFRNKINYLNTKISLIPHLTIRENLNSWSNIIGLPTVNEYHLLEYFNLYDKINVPIKELSVGQTKKVCLIKFLCNIRPIWFLDEPTLGLDKQSISLFEKKIKEHQQDGGLVVLVSHTDLLLDNIRNLYLK